MANNGELAAALTALSNTVTTLGAPAPARNIILDPFAGGNPFNLSTRSVAAAYELLSSP